MRVNSNHDSAVAADKRKKVAMQKYLKNRERFYICTEVIGGKMVFLTVTPGFRMETTDNLDEAKLFSTSELSDVSNYVFNAMVIPKEEAVKLSKNIIQFQSIDHDKIFMI